MRLHLEISGIVQGVSYRFSAREEAQALGLTGWVRNRPDGSVELVAEGQKAALEALLRWCEEGPPGARVDRVIVHFSEEAGSFERFEVRR